MLSRIRSLLELVSQGELEIDQALDSLKTLPFEDLGYAKVDHHRPFRTGAPETIFCSGKTLSEIREIAGSLVRAGEDFMATRADENAYLEIAKKASLAKYHERARVVTVGEGALPKRGLILVASGGTSDIPVAEEAAITAEMLGAKVERLYDVGVAGIHRLLAQQERLDRANVIIAAAGMEGALASVIAGLVSSPIIALPTSVGYGASFGGLSALLTMMNSCCPGIAVVNIDNGFGAGTIAARINSLKLGDLKDADSLF